MIRTVFYTLFHKIMQALLYNKRLTCIRNFFVKIIPDKKFYSIISKSESFNLLCSYDSSSKDTPYFSGVIMMFDGKAGQPGLADCLRGIASVYYLCKTNNIPFRICYKHPFELSDYLVPNEYQWTIDDDQITFDKNKAYPVVCASYNSIFGENNLLLQKEYLIEKLTNCKGKQIHLYSNTFCYDEHFNDMFYELFSLSDKLKHHIDYNLECLEGKYISASFRFATLLGDLKDTYGTPLSNDDREQLMQCCINAIEELHKNHPEYKKILITTDSVTFSERVKQILDYVYIIPGTMGHLAYNGAEEVVIKTFLDLFLISRAETVYMIRTGIMYRSSFAKRAALIGNKPFIEVTI